MRREAAEAFPDPTYVKAQIDANPVWRRAWELSELFNDNAPIGWSNFIEQAELDIAKVKAMEAGATLGFDPASGNDRTVITLTYVGEPKANRGLQDAIAALKARYPGAEIVTRQEPAP